MFHETKNMISMSAWCNVCGKTTQHSVSGKRQGPCLEHAKTGMSKAQEKRAEQREKDEREPRLL